MKSRSSEQSNHRPIELSDNNQTALNFFNEAIALINQRKFTKAEQKISQYQSLINYNHFPQYDNRFDEIPIVSVIIVAYHTNELLIECLQSLDTQDSNQFEIIIVDNGGNESVAQQLKERRLLHIQCPQNMFLSEGRNIGARFARGRYLAFLDDDAQATPDYISSILRVFRRYRIAAIRGKVLPPKNDNTDANIKHYNPGDIAIPFIINTEGNSAFNKKVYLEFGGMNPLLFGHEGWELSYKISRKYGSPATIYWPETVIFHEYASTDQKREHKEKRHALMNAFITSRNPRIKSYRKSMKAALKSEQHLKNAHASLIKREPMRIAYIHSGDWPSNSPSTIFVTYNAFALAEAADSCYLIVRENSRQSPEDILKTMFGVVKPATLHVRPIRAIMGKISKYFFYLNAYSQLKKLVRDKKVTHLITRRVTFLPWLMRLKKRYHVPLFFESHDFYAELSIRDDINRSRTKKFQKLEQKYIPQINGVICLQQAQQSLYQQYFSQQTVFLARTGIHQITKSDSIDRKYICYIGSLDAHKGVKTLLQAAAKSTTQPHVLIIGGKSEAEISKYYKISEELYRTDRVTITGWISRAEMFEYLQKVNIGVIPLRDTFFNRHLTSPLKLFDFYSYGIPVIASDLPTLRELITDNETGLFFQSENADELAKKIDYLTSNENILVRMRENVFQAAENLLWKKRAATIIENLGNEY